MHLSRSAVVLVGLVAIGMTQISDAKKTRVRNLFNRKNEGLDNEDTAFLGEALSDEDEQYWDRILQQSASVPSVRPPTVVAPTVPVPAPTNVDTTRCVQSGGTIQNAMCCRGVGDFPNTCAIGSCGCSPFESQMVLTCVCPAGTCFNGNACRPTVRPTVPPPTNAPPTNAPPTFRPPTNPVPTNPPPTFRPPTNPPPTNPPPTNRPPTNPPPTPRPTKNPEPGSSFSFVRRTRRLRRVKKRNDSDA